MNLYNGASFSNFVLQFSNLGYQAQYLGFSINNGTTFENYNIDVTSLNYFPPAPQPYLTLLNNIPLLNQNGSENVILIAHGNKLYYIVNDVVYINYTETEYSLLGNVDEVYLLIEDHNLSNTLNHKIDDLMLYSY